MLLRSPSLVKVPECKRTRLDSCNIQQESVVAVKNLNFNNCSYIIEQTRCLPEKYNYDLSIYSLAADTYTSKEATYLELSNQKLMI